MLLNATYKGKRLYDHVRLWANTASCWSTFGFLQPVDTPDILISYSPIAWVVPRSGTMCPIYIITIIYKHPFNMYYQYQMTKLEYYNIFKIYKTI